MSVYRGWIGATVGGGGVTVGVGCIVATVVVVADTSQANPGRQQAGSGRKVVGEDTAHAETVEETVVAIREFRSSNGVPDVTAGSFRHIGNWRKPVGEGWRECVAVGVLGWKSARKVAVVLAFEVVIPAAIAVVIRQVLDHVLVSHGLRAPRPAITAGFARVVEVIQQHEALREGVQVRRDTAAEQYKAGIAIPLWHVAEHLIIGAVLLDNIDHMGDPARL